jgi:hypothetical protein
MCSLDKDKHGIGTSGPSCFRFLQYKVPVKRGPQPAMIAGVSTKFARVWVGAMESMFEALSAL